MIGGPPRAGRTIGDERGFREGIKALKRSGARRPASTVDERRTSGAKLEVRTLSGDEWQLYRTVRLAALRDDPQAFVAGFDEEASYDDDVWRERVIRAHCTVAERAGEPVGLVCLGPHGDDPRSREVFGLWTVPAARGEGVATALVAAAVRHAIEGGAQLLYFWVSSDNGPAVGFASGFGFRPTSQRRTARIPEGAVAEEADQVALVLSLRDDPTQVRHPYHT